MFSSGMDQKNCGLFPTPDMALQFVSNKSAEPLENRIINGQSVDFDIPWMVRLTIKKGSKESICTGSIITAWHVMTAAHCFCHGERCLEEFSPNILLDHDRVFAFVGGPSKKDMIRHRAKSAKIHPGYKGAGPQNDIAILFLYVSIGFSQKVRPLCLPKVSTSDHVNETVFTAGWGLRYVEEKRENAVDVNNPRSSCITNELGPDIFAQCAQGWMGCNRIDSPPWLDARCFNLTRHVSFSSPIVEFFGDIVNNERRPLTCYANPIGEYGWCKTQIAWGFCSRSCMMAQTPLDELEFVSLQIVEALKCDSSIDMTSELCVAGIAPRPNVTTFTTQLVGQKYKKYNFTNQGMHLRDGWEAPVIGFKDSCSGDSGSPLWKFEKRGDYYHAVAVGLTSRGASLCGELDTPAIYTGIIHHLPWIQKTISQNGSSSRKRAASVVAIVVTTRILCAH